MTRILLRIALILLFALGTFFLAPPTRDGVEQIHLARSQFLTGAVEPGEVAPVFPGSTLWTSGLLAASDQLAAIAKRAEGEPWTDYVAGRRSSNVQLLRLAFSLLAGLLLFRASQFCGRFTDDSPWLAGILVTAALAPPVFLGVSQMSAALLAGWLILEMGASWWTEPPRVTWSAVVAAGFLLAWAPFAWPFAALFVLLAVLQQRPIGSLSGRLLLLVLLAAALDPSRLVGFRDGIAMTWFEWVRGGGFPPLTTDVLGRGLRPGGWHWVTIALACVGWAFWWKGTRSCSAATGVTANVPTTTGATIGATIGRASSWPAFAWMGGILSLSFLGPYLFGIRSSGMVQAAVVPVVTLGVGALAGAALPRGLFRARILPIAASLILLVVLVLQISQRSPVHTTALAERIAVELQEHVGDGLLLAERQLPGGAGLPDQSFLVPRDSRNPDRYAFAYWPRWFMDVDFVLLAGSAYRENLQRGGGPSHFYQQLFEVSDLLAEWRDSQAEDEWLFRLYQIQEASSWTAPLGPDDFAGMTAVPELEPYLSQLGTFLAEAGRLSSAALLFEQGVRFFPESAPMHNNLGSLYLLESEWDSAARVLTTGLARAPESTEMLFNCGRAHFELGSFERSEQLFRRSVNLRPDFGKAHYELARSFLAQEKLGLAQMALKNYLEVEPDSPRRASIESVLQELSSPSSRPTPGGQGP